MTSVAEARPRFGPDEAREIARDRFGVDGRVTELPSERDQNFRVRERETSDPGYVLKISSRNEDPEVLRFQHRALEHALSRDPELPLPRLITTPDGGETVEVEDREGRTHAARMVRWLPGRRLAGVRPRLPRLLEELGDVLGRLDRALTDFDHPAADRPLVWNLDRGPAEIRKRLELLDPPARRELVERHLGRVEERLAPVRDGLPTSVIHGDANDHNVLVRVESPGALRRAVGVAGLIDLGDACLSRTVSELAIACAYVALHEREPASAVTPLVRGYHGARALGEDELEALFPLMVLRMCVSVSVAAEQGAAEPEQPYLTVSRDPAWRFLEWADETSWTRAHYLFRHASGLPPCPRQEAVTAWLDAPDREAARVVEPDPRTARVSIFDFSMDEHEWTGVPLEAAPDEWSERIFGAMRRRETPVALGRYAEPRRWYTSAIFRQGGLAIRARRAAERRREPEGFVPPPPDEATDPRTVHLGVDIFVQPGSRVFTPFDGTVRAVANNLRPLDYGPTLVVEHDADGEPFWLLYGHLGREILEEWSPGDAVRRGQQIATVGTYPMNGGWAPHLHFQILLDPLGRASDYPGVARPSEWDFWSALSPDPNLVLGIPGLEPWSEERPAEEILAHRRRHLGPNLSVSYERPLKIVRGWMQHLYDIQGRDYLDARNNVPHVGHCHPRVADAARRQGAVLDTNTRYLHDALVEYTERLTATLPEPLSVCYLVCTGSEANELALRMARAYTGTRETVVLEGAYHGNTNALVEISPYKFRGPGGRGAPGHVHPVPMPDPYRGPHRDAEDPGERYAARVKEAVERLETEGRGPATFIAEPILGCGGQVVPPDGFLARAFEHVRRSGGVTIADEVQIGFGRIGTHFWAFEAQAAVPDILTLGKPIGNGYPLAAVVTTPEVARAFDTGMEYFNTFGGSPVACRVGLAVLDVIEEEGLQERALTVGRRLLEGLEGLKERYPLVGDVRGSGLFLGAELVTDRRERTPATDHARYVVERLRDQRILAGSDGPDDNVLKLKPPLQFDGDDADRLVAALDRILAEAPLRVD